MTDLLTKLNYKQQDRIAIIRGEESFMSAVSEPLKGKTIDTSIDPRYPYSFIIIFVKTRKEVEELSPAALHNLVADGVLWFCYPKKTSKKLRSDVDRDHGWKALNDSGFQGIRMVSIDDDWSAMRFRNIKYIKSSQ
ncbi:MAG TPA: hypothetical protein VHO68_12785 [Bacteroidales bacterium]|nr:hypothetical protein [Bacteroidales bacterium]